MKGWRVGIAPPCGRAILAQVEKRATGRLQRFPTHPSPLHKVRCQIGAPTCQVLANDPGCCDDNSNSDQKEGGGVRAI